jgi:hypothetical protein
MRRDDIAMHIIWYLTYLLVFSWFTSPGSAGRVEFMEERTGTPLALLLLACIHHRAVYLAVAGRLLGLLVGVEK